MAKPSSIFPPGTRVVLYLRRSKDVQEESLETQRRGALEYCAARGWIVVGEFVDDAVSRAEFKKRTDLIRLLNHAGRKEFQLVVMRDESRLGGDMQRTGLVMQDLDDAGVGIVYYISDELVSMEGAVDKFLVAARNFASELEREKISSRTYEHLMQKAKAGKPAGGISYGYAIVDKQYVVKEPEASVVRRIFAAYAVGAGQRSITRQLNNEHVPAPRAGRRGTGSWAPTAIRAILTNPRYVGEGRYNQTRKLYKGGTKVRERRPAAEHFTYACPAIVDRATWEAVAMRFETNARFGTRPGVVGARPGYLLTGISRCGQCGGPMTVGRRKSGQVNTNVYLCGWRKNRGLAVCQNTTVERVDVVDARVIAVVRQLITPDIIADVIRQARQILAERRAAVPAEAQRLRAEVDKLRREVERLTTAIATMDEPPMALLQAVTERDKRLRNAESDLAKAEAVSSAADDTLDALEFEARRRLRDIHQGFDAAEHARAALTTLTDGERLRFDVAEGRFKVHGSVGVSGLLRPENAVADCVASPAGFNTVGSALEAAGPLRLPFAA